MDARGATKSPKNDGLPLASTPTGGFDRLTRRLRLTFFALGCVVAALQSWESRHFMNVDGISYLDVADAYRAGDWAGAINGHWSPLYSWVLAFGLSLLRPSPYWQYAAVHLINFVIFVVSLVAFEVLLREIWRAQRSATSDHDAPGLPPWAWVAIAYPIALWTSLSLVTVWTVSPDLLVSVFVYLAAALLLRVWRQRSLGAAAALGAVLGLGFLAKAPMLPLGLVFLGVASAGMRSARAAMKVGGVAAAMLMLVAGPFIAALSVDRGRLTFGDSRVMAYVWVIDDVPLRNYQGGGRAGGRLAHPTRKIGETPAVYEFASPLRGSYPVWYDPSYWYEGIEPVFDARAHARALVASAREYHGLLLGYVQSSLPVVLALFLAAGAGRPFRQGLPWMVLTPATAGLAMYSVLLVLPRYIGPLLCLWWLGAFAFVRMPPSPTAGRVTATGCAIVAATMLLATAVSTMPRVVGALRHLSTGAASDVNATANEAFTVAAALGARGVGGGDRVAIVYPPSEFRTVLRMVGWARLAGVTIAAEVPDEEANAFWTANASVRARVLDVFRDLGAKAVVAMNVPADVQREGWMPVVGTEHFVLAVR